MPSKTSGPTDGANDTQDVEPTTPDEATDEQPKRTGAYDLVRVRQGKTEVSMTRIAAKRAGLKAIDGKSAVDERGRALAPKPVNDRATAQEA